MFNAFLPKPHVITLPAIAADATFEYEIVGALDVSDYERGALLLRVHSGNSDTVLSLVAYKVWPDDASGVRFQDTSPQDPILDTGATAAGASGVLVSSSSEILGAPWLRVVLRVLASGGAISAGESVTVSAGVVLTS